jgi:hypothetical protein
MPPKGYRHASIREGVYARLESFMEERGLSSVNDALAMLLDYQAICSRLEQLLQAGVRRVEAQEAPRGLVKLHLLSMRLPSRYLVQSVEVEGGREVRRWEGEARGLASRLEGLRRRCVEVASRSFAYVEELGAWVSADEGAVKEAEAISKLLAEALSGLNLAGLKGADVPRSYGARVLPVWLEPEHARWILEAAVGRLSKAVEELRRRLEAAEKGGREAARLKGELASREAMLKGLEGALTSIKLAGAQGPKPQTL